MTAPPFLDVLEELITTVVDPAAANVDATGTAAILHRRRTARRTSWAGPSAACPGSGEGGHG